jgi:hypothetical protein
MWYICHKRRATTPMVGGVRVGLRSKPWSKNSWAKK